jgi:hypothetical protein
VELSSQRIRIVSDPLTKVAIYNIKPAPNQLFLRQDSSLLKEVTHRMLKRRRKYRRSDGIAIRRQPLNRAL